MRKLRITVGNKSYDVTVEDLTGADAYPDQPKPASAGPSTVAPTRVDTATSDTAANQSATPESTAARPGPSARPPLPVDPGAVTSPMAGAIQSVLVKVDDVVKQGQPLVILEAMKMENQITAPVAGTVRSLAVAEGNSVTEGQVLLVLE